MTRSVYEPLGRWLASCGCNSVNLNFAQMETILGRTLPPSAHQYDVWWGPSSTHTQSKYGWMAAGFIVTTVDRGFPCATFIRIDGSR